LDVQGEIAALDLDRLLPPATGPAPAPPARAVGFVTLAYAAPGAAAPPAPPAKITARLAVGKVTHAHYRAQEFDFRCALTEVTPDLGRVSGTAQLKQGAGHLLHLDKVAAASPTARLALLPLVTLQKIDRKGVLKKLGLPSLDAVPFDSIQGDYRLTNGVMDIRAFELSGKDLFLSTLGTVGLAGDQSIDLKVLMRLAPGAVRGTLGQLIQDESGRPSLSFAATWSVADPRVRVETKEIGRKALKQVGDGLLKGLGLERPPSKSERGADAAPSNGGVAAPSAPDPLRDFEKKLKKIFR
jgi:hypothetical protein